LNLCFRSLAGVLKYDNEIPLIGGTSTFRKGYYSSEAPLVDLIRKAVLGSHEQDGKLEVIEMQIMDLADDIAYSTYDFEDALKAGFASPLDIVMQLNSNVEVRDAVARKLFNSELGREYPKDNPSSEDRDAFAKIQTHMALAVYDLLKQYFEESEKSIDLEGLQRADADDRLSAVAAIAVKLQKLSEQAAQNGYVRALFTSDVVGKRIRATDIEVNEAIPALSKLKIPKEVRFQIDVLKHLTYELHIKSPRLKLIEYRGKQIVHELFDCYEKDKEGELLPNDWRDRLRAMRGFAKGEEMRKRLICDYIAGMTDAYALDVYSRLMTTNPAALFRPN
jgi:dGTPase